MTRVERVAKVTRNQSILTSSMTKKKMTVPCVTCLAMIKKTLITITIKEEMTSQIKLTKEKKTRKIKRTRRMKRKSPMKTQLLVQNQATQIKTSLLHQELEIPPIRKKILRKMNPLIINRPKQILKKIRALHLLPHDE